MEVTDVLKDYLFIYLFILFIYFPQDFEILGWCPTVTFLPHGEKVPL